MDLHIYYGEVPVYEGVEIAPLVNPSYKATKMRFVHGSSAIEWIMYQYQIKIDKKSGITDNTNDYSDDEKYIFNLLLRIINVSIQTIDLINSLLKFEVEE